MKRWIRMVALAAVLSMGVPVASTAASGTLYMYADKDYKAPIGYRSVTGWWNMSAANDNTLSSVKNRSDWSAAFWQGSNRSGKCWDYSPWTNDPSFWWFDDNTASSYALGRGC